MSVQTVFVFHQCLITWLQEVTITIGGINIVKFPVSENLF